jgi:hypothetical protein
VTGEPLYQFVRQKGRRATATFQNRFLQPGGKAYAFTFG